MVILTAIYVALTAVYVCVSIKMLRSIRDQGAIAKRSAEATEIAAKAAKASAEALTNSERAWIIVNKINPTRIIDPPSVGPMSSLWFWLTFINSGKTVARITDVQGRFHTVKTLNDLPLVPDYSQRAIPKEMFFGRIVAPKQEFDFGMVFEEQTLTGEKMKQIRENDLTLCAYGWVEYIDFTNETRTSQFCYVYTAPKGLVTLGINDQERFQTGGPQAYNRYT
jgi:hypothetical protein